MRQRPKDAVVHLRLSKQELASLKAAVPEGQTLAAFIRGQLMGVIETPGLLGTVALLDAIVPAADAAQSAFGDWREDRFAYEVVRLVVERLMERQRPPGEAIPHVESERDDFLYGASPTVASATKTLIAMLGQKEKTNG